MATGGPMRLALHRRHHVEGHLRHLYELLLGAWTFLIVAAILRAMPMRRLLAGGAAAVAVFLAATVAFLL